mgnify:CR=1 FL=1
MKEEFPDIIKNKERVAEGRWEADGAMWWKRTVILPAENLLQGRFFLEANFIKDEFGKDVEYLWLSGCVRIFLGTSTDSEKSRD